jgi:hypothetical protein
MATNLTHLELKGFVETCLSGMIGTYSFSGGTLPAIALLPHPQFGVYFPPDDWRVSGIEVVIIKPTANPANAKQMTGGDIGINYPWKIVLKQHDQFGDLATAMDALLIAAAAQYHLLPGMGGYVPPSKDNLVIASGVVCILDPTVQVNE